MDPEKYLTLLSKYKKKHGIYPSASVLPFIFDTNDREVNEILEHLADAGKISLSQEGEILEEVVHLSNKETKNIPISRESILAGFPEALQDDLQESIDIHAYLVDTPDKTIIIPIKGNSMELAGITDGDLGIIELTNTASPGDIVAAEIDGNFTLKRLALTANGLLFLKAENDSYPDMHPLDSLRIHGRLVGLARRY